MYYNAIMSPVNETETEVLLCAKREENRSKNIGWNSYRLTESLIQYSSSFSTLLYDWENDFLVIGWEQANVSLALNLHGNANYTLHTAGAREIWIDQSGFSRREKF